MTPMKHNSNDASFLFYGSFLSTHPPPPNKSKYISDIISE